MMSNQLNKIKIKVILIFIMKTIHRLINRLENNLYVKFKMIKNQGILVDKEKLIF